MSPFYLFYMLAAVLASGALARGAVNDAADSGPRIAEVRIGLANHFKVGCWTPVRVVVDSPQALVEPHIAVTVADSDGVATTVTAPLATAGASEGRATASLYTKIGRAGSPVHIALIDDGQQISEARIRPGGSRPDDRDVVELPATGELVATIGRLSAGVAAALAGSEDVRGKVTRRVARLTQVEDLPAEWFGYESVDLLVIDANGAIVLRELAADTTRYAALVRWIELGGRLAIFCGGEAAQEMLADGGPLQALAPGRMTDVVRLPETGPLQHYAGSEVAIAPGGSRQSILVPQLVGVEGAIEVYAGRRQSELPLVVRSVRGLGEVAFVGLDLDAQPLSHWPGRKPMLQAVLRPYTAQRNEAEAVHSLVVRGYNDLAGALRQRLGRSFAGIAPIPFSIVTILAIAYLLVLGPLDYLFVHRWVRRPWVAWASFPSIVLLSGLAALALGDWRQTGGEPRVNRLELVDIDLTSGQMRGTFWATLYSPRAMRFDLALDLDLPGADTTTTDSLLSWWGLPGVGVGGMQAGGTDFAVVRDGYRYGERLDSLFGAPVLTSSTKSLVGRWTAPAPALLNARLTDEDGLVAGVLANQSDVTFRSVRLLYNSWAYRLGDLKPGERIDVGDKISPRRAKTIVTQDALGPTLPGREDGGVFAARRATAEQVLSLMMFYEAAGGFGFAQLANEYQAYCDLSRLLELGRAVLVADVSTHVGRLVDAGSGEPVAGQPKEASVVYRFVLPVARNEDQQ